MKVLLVSTGSGSRGGGEYYLLTLARALRDQGHDVHLSIPDHPRMEEMRKRGSELATVHVVNGKNTYDRPLRHLGALLDAGSVKRYCALFRSVAPDVIHVNQQVLEDGLEIIRAARRSNYPFVLTTHVTHGARELGARFGWVRDHVSEYVVSRAGCPVITVSSSTRQVLITRLAADKAAAERVHVVYNGVDCVPPLLAEQRRSIRAGWGVHDDTPVIGVVGRIEQQKNPLFFARLLSEVKSMQMELKPQFKAEFKAVWVGDGQMRPAFMEAVETLGLEAHVHIDGWRDDVADRLCAMDIFVLPSKFEGLPFALQEAMCAALPVCVAEVDGMGEVITDGVNGLLCKGDDVSHWASRINALLSDNEIRKSLGQQARDFAQVHFSTAIMAKKTVGVYDDAIASFRKQS